MVKVILLVPEFDLPTGETAEERAAAGGTMSCQELLALSGALSAALPTGQVALDSFFEELTKGISKRAGEDKMETKVITYRFLKLENGYNNNSPIDCLIADC